MEHSEAKKQRYFKKTILKIISVIGILHIYIGVRIIPDLELTETGNLFAEAVLTVIFILILYCRNARKPLKYKSAKDRIRFAGYIALGLFSSLFVLTFIRDLTLLVFNTPEYKTISAIICTALAFAATLAGYFNARSIAEIKHVSVPIKNLHPELAHLKIVQLSDIHIGPTIKGDFVQAVVERVNTLNADAVVITGDVVDGDVAHLAKDAEPLAQLKSRYGSYMVLGNHDYFSGALEWTKQFQHLGITVLCNEHVILEHNGSHIALAGVPDYTAHRFVEEHVSDPKLAIANCPANTVKILLSHQPRLASLALAAGFDLQLSGHTHGGQFWPWNFFVPLQQPYVAGLQKLESLWIYISKGTGYWGPPKRIGAASEITLITLVNAD